MENWILLKAVVRRYRIATASPVTVYRWHCRMCGAEGRAWSYRWSYIRWLGLTHFKNNHPHVTRS
jgi:hypothetical protein